MTNIILWDGATNYEVDAHLELLPEGSDVGIGWRRTGEVWLAPDPGPIDETEA